MNEFFKGKLQRWNDAKGFGFIVPEQGEAQVFIHISALKNMSRRPIIGDMIWYQVTVDGDGRRKAVNARIEGVVAHKKKVSRSRTSFGQFLSNLVGMVFIVALGIFGYQKITQHLSIIHLQSQQPSTETLQLQQPSTETLQLQQPSTETETFNINQDNNITYQCDGRIHCSQMTSREEAEYFVSHCPGTKMDGDHDGEPCENDTRF